MPRPLAPLALLLLCSVACKDDDDSTGTLASFPFPTAAMSEPDPDTGDAPTSEAADATSAASDATSADATSADATSADATSAGPSTSAASEASADGTSAGETSDDTTAPAPTDGPGLLPGETGLDAFCRRYVECGGTYYDGAQACIDESLGYWGECKSRRDALDAFGECMSNLDCSEWNPDAYNPGSTPCSQQWSDLGASEAC